MNIVPFAYGDQVVRTAGTPEAPLFAGKDVCQCLGLKNHNQALSALAENERDWVQIVDPIGRPQEMTFVTEPGLFRLILRSRKPSAVAFQTWLFHEVLPAIRRTGSYSMPGAASSPPRYSMPRITDELIIECIPWTGRSEDEFLAMVIRRLEIDPETTRLAIAEAVADERITRGHPRHDAGRIFRGSRLPATRALTAGHESFDDAIAWHNNNVRERMINAVRAMDDRSAFLARVANA